MNRKALAQKDHVKYLGVMIDEHLSWNHHINHVTTKISRGIGILAKLRSFMKTDLLKTIYYCLVYSHLSYGVNVWGSACDSELVKIQVLLKKAARIMTGTINVGDFAMVLPYFVMAGPLF